VVDKNSCFSKRSAAPILKLNVRYLRKVFVVRGDDNPAGCNRTCGNPAVLGADALNLSGKRCENKHGFCIVGMKVVGRDTGEYAYQKVVRPRHTWFITIFLDYAECASGTVLISNRTQSDIRRLLDAPTNTYVAVKGQ
jgi:hypothetical protein